MVFPWLIALIVTVAVNVAVYLITPKPKAPKPPAVQQGEVPTAEAGRPVPVPFGSIKMKELNVLWYGDTLARQYEIKV